MKFCQMNIEIPQICKNSRIKIKNSFSPKLNPSYVSKLTSFYQHQIQLTLSSNNTDWGYNLLSHHKIRQDFYISPEILLSRLQVLG